MANITEQSVWESGVFQLETATPVLGGPVGFDAGVPVTGHSNAQAQQLANRTKYLNDAKASKTDLANTSDPVKGASMVGYSAGVTVKQALQDTPSKTKNSTITAQYDFNGGGWGKIYDTDVWICGKARVDPTNNSQGLYVQHRVAGNLGGLVHDAAAAELRFAGASNSGTGQSAFEASLVVSAGENNMSSINALLANFHTAGTPTGNINEVALCRLSQIPPLAPGFSINKVYGLVVDSQIVGTSTNYGIYSPGINVLGPVTAKDAGSFALVAKGVKGQTATVLAVQNNASAPLFSVSAAGTAGVGNPISGSSFYINNNLATASTVVLRSKAHPSQSVDIVQHQNSDGTPVAGVNKSGAIYTALNTEPADADISAGQCLFWFDSTNGSAAFKIKAKQADGTVKTASIPLV